MNTDTALCLSCSCLAHAHSRFHLRSGAVTAAARLWALRLEPIARCSSSGPPPNLLFAASPFILDPSITLKSLESSRENKNMFEGDSSRRVCLLCSGGVVSELSRSHTSAFGRVTRMPPWVAVLLLWFGVSADPVGAYALANTRPLLNLCLGQAHLRGGGPAEPRRERAQTAEEGVLCRLKKGGIDFELLCHSSKIAAFHGTQLAVSGIESLSRSYRRLTTLQPGQPARTTC